MTTTTHPTTTPKSARPARTDARYCRIPKCTNDAVAVLAGVYIEPVPLCEDHFEPVRRFVLGLLAPIPGDG